MVDLFEEVEDELRAEQYKKLALKLAPWVIGGLVAGGLIAAVIYGAVRYQENMSAKAAGTYASALETMNQADPETVFKQLNDVPKGAKAYKSMALALQAGIRMEQNKTAEAVKLLDDAAKAAPGGKAGLILADSARLKAAWAVLDDAPYAEVEKRLKPLTEDGRPYRALANEALGVALMNAGRAAEAKSLFTRLSVDPSAPQGLAQRAKQAVTIIDDGAAAVVPAATKAAKNVAPPPPPPPPGMNGIPPELMEQLRAQAAAQGASQGGQAPAGGGQ